MEALQIIKDVRAKLEDNNEIKFSDYDLMLTLNEGYKFFRKICIDEAPEFIAITYEGSLDAGVNKIYFGSHDNEEEDLSDNVYNVKPIRILDLRCNGVRVYPCNRFTIEDLTQTGSPTNYYLSNQQDCVVVNITPIPQDTTPFNIIIVDEVSKVTDETNLYITNEVEELLVNFIVARRAGQDTSAYDDLATSLKQILKRYVPSPEAVIPYY